MIYLIVPPVIIILAIAILIVFLVRVLPSDKKNSRKVTEMRDTKITKSLKKSKKFLQDTGESATKRIKKSLETTTVVQSNNNGDSVRVPGIMASGTVENVVSLRKKSMVSDKIDDGEERDIEEVSLMKEIENDSQNSKKYELLGDYYMEHEKFEDARECYKYVLRLDPRHKRAQVAMRNLDRVLQ